MNFRYVSRECALLSIEEQTKWLEDSLGYSQADFWTECLMQTLDLIDAHPERNGFAPENGKWFSQVEIRPKRLKVNLGLKNESGRSQAVRKRRRFHLLRSLGLHLEESQ